MASISKLKSSKMAISRSRIPSNSIPQPLCPDHITNLAHMAAVKARQAAEAYFTLGNFKYAIMQAKAVKEFDPDLSGMDNYMTAYQMHSAVSPHKQNWYRVLGIENPTVADSETIKKQYKRLALALHPDKNASIVAEGAFKHVKAALDVLSNPAKREAYNKSLKRQLQAAHGSNKRRASECKPPQSERSNTFPRKRSSPSGDGSCYKKTIKIIRKSNPGQKVTVMMVSVCRVA
ncbi:dnaJ homolog subfamily C member 7 homolog [Pyrus x bretschneideri]|uniref:dnaJ homolog subfamily C member 7 homolog n=1 Tax=Pyrus x bretschneideri TaxID=225117 RepID=UPI00202DF5DC|nr:dnaJ homolog subfamily C member 7 homolog [Pyrus x bretschneideri]